MDLNDENYLRRAREGVGLSQAELAELVGLKNKSAISLLENRHRVPRPETLGAIAHKVGLPASELFLWSYRLKDRPE